MHDIKIVLGHYHLVSSNLLCAAMSFIPLGAQLEDAEAEESQPTQQRVRKYFQLVTRFHKFVELQQVNRI